MGTWGLGSFDNDDALDWLIELERSEGLSAITRALNTTTDGPMDYLETPDCCIALAAAEIVAALAGYPGPALPEEATQWLRVHQSLDADIVNKARRAVNTILHSSELDELWRESDEFEQWKAVVINLLDRLVLKSNAAT